MRCPLLLLATALLLSAPEVRGESATEAYRAMGIEAKDVLSGTCLAGKVVPGDTKQLTCVTTFLTGDRDDGQAVNVRIDVFDLSPGRLRARYARNLGQERDGFVGDGNLQLVDLDLDAVNEIVLSYRSFADRLIEQELGEVLFHEPDGGFRVAWSGPLRYDSTRAAREVPQERRDRYRREIDFARTLRTRGGALYFTKYVMAVAGERLDEPRRVSETFPLRLRE